MSAPTSILVTGANGELGLAIAQKFLAGPQTTVFLGVRKNRDAASALAAEHPGHAHLVDLDVADPKSWDNTIATIIEKAGHLDVLVNNAGFHSDALLATMDDHAWSSVLDTNLTGVFYGCRSVVKTMMANRFGRIINIASLSALLSPAGQANYAAAKAGVLALSSSLAKEVARAGITVNSLCPGYIETAALGDLDPEKRNALARTIPMRRLGKPAEVAATVHFLASPDAAYITGATLKIDGGIL